MGCLYVVHNVVRDCACIRGAACCHLMRARNWRQKRCDSAVFICFVVVDSSAAKRASTRSMVLYLTSISSLAEAAVMFMIPSACSTMRLRLSGPIVEQMSFCYMLALTEICLCVASSARICHMPPSLQMLIDRTEPLIASKLYRGLDSRLDGCCY